MYGGKAGQSNPETRPITKAGKLMRQKNGAWSFLVFSGQKGGGTLNVSEWANYFTRNEGT